MNHRKYRPHMGAVLRQGVVVSLAYFSVLAGSAWAADFDWTAGAPANWNNGASWNPAGPPSGGALNNAYIDNGGTAIITSDIPDIQDIHVGSGAGGVGTLTQTGGHTFQGTGGWVFVGQSGGVGTYNLSGGTQDKSRLFIGQAGTGFFNLSGSGVLDNDALLIGVAGGTGHVTMSGGTINTGQIDLTNGTFDMTGGLLSTTTFNGDLTQDGGTTAPGSSPGLMTINGNYALNAGDLFMELGGLTAGTEYDQLIVNGDVSLAGGLTLSLLPGFTPLLGDVFTIIDNMGVNPVSGGFLEGMSISVDGFGFDIDYMGGDGNDVVLTLVSSAVPAPGVVLLLLAGLAVVFRAKRRSRIGGGEAVLSPL